MKKDSREYLFDNYKVLLIFLVVIGHFIEPCCDQNPYLYELKWAIVAFHMPAFIFISGYFSKQLPSIKKLIRGLVIPYFAYELIYYFLYTLVIHKSTGLYFARPKFTLWYLMALFAWRIVAPWVQKIPHHLALSIVAGLLIGYTQFGNFLSIPRIVFFFPFFLAGLDFDSRSLEKYRNPFGFGAAFALLAGFLLFLFADPIHRTMSYRIFYGRYSYADMGQGNLEGLLIRLFCYGISFLLVYLFMLVLPAQKRPYSYLGQRTMAIYIFHGMIYSCFKYGSNVLSSVRTNQESLALLGFCFVLVWVLSTKPFVAVTNKIAHLI